MSARGDASGDERIAREVVSTKSLGEILTLISDLRREPVSDPDPSREALANSDFALRLLEAIAALRPVADVVAAVVRLDSGSGSSSASSGGSGGGGDTDALALTETAALTAGSRQAAELAAGLIRAGRPQLGREVADQVARHRLPREVSVFADALLGDGDPGLATVAMDALRVAGEQRSMRTVARIFLSLRALERERIADRLLDSIFPPAHTVRELKELAAVLGELSPHEAVLPDRIFALSRARLTVGQIAELARELHDGKTSATAKPFIQDAAKAREITEIVELYRLLRHDGLAELATLVVTTAAAERRAGDVVILALTLDREQPDDGILLRQRAAARTDLRDLVDLVPRWQHRLRKQFPELISAIVAAHPIDLIHELAGELTETGRTDWAQQLRVAALRAPGNRTGTELARMLWRIDEPRVRRSEGRRLTEWIATKFGQDRDAEVGRTRDLLIEYVRELDSQDSGALIRTLWDGLLTSTRDAGRLTGLAEQLWRDGPRGYATDLLRQWLEQQELVGPAALPAIARQLRAFLPEQELAALLTQTVSRWAPAMRSGAITGLLAGDLPEEAAALRRAALR